MTAPLDELLEEWQLVPDGALVRGTSSLVQPVRADGRPAVLKLAAPRPEAEHEALALQRWGGRGAVRLLRADPHRRALLLERLSAQDLGDAWDVQACETVAGLYRTLHVAAPPQLERLGAYVARRLAAPPEHLPRRLVEQARAFARDVPDGDDRLLHTRLHYANVLSDGTEWVAISPAPLAGDPHYEVAPMLWHRFEELAGRIREGVRERFFTLVDAAELDEHRARGWVAVRAVLLAGERPDLTTVAIAVAKAVQD